MATPSDRLGPASLALALLAGVTVFVLSAWAGWLAGWALHGWASATLAVLGVVAVLRAVGHSLAAALRAAGLVALAAAALAGVGHALYDLSTDGQLYHQQAVMLMAQGWNPLRHPASPLDNWSTIWVDGYAKTHWVYAALWVDLGAGLQAGKSFTWVLALAAGLLAHALLTERLAWSPRAAACMAALMVFNPVFATEWPTFLNDHTLACTLLLALLSLAWAAWAPPAALARRQAAALLVLAFALLAAVKASGVAYAGVFLVLGAPLLAWGCGLGRGLRVAAWAVAGIAAGVLVLGFNPYVTNTLRHGHPFYPLAGEGKVDIISNNVPAGVAEQPRLVKLFGSLAARSSSVIGGPVNPDTLAPKLPGSISLAEVKLFLTKNDVRIAGFGPWFSLALTVAVAGVAWAWARRRRPAWQQGLLVAPMVLLMLSALAFPEPWWARYIPQVWLVPLVAAVALITGGRAEGDRAQRVLGWGIAAIAGLNVALVALLFIAGNAPRQLDMRAQLQSLQALSQAQVLEVDVALAPAQGVMFDELGIRWRPTDAAAGCVAPGAAWVRIEYTYGRVCLDEAQRRLYRTQSPWVERLKSLR